jgi:flavin reductase (DIM6/NTAB) family NADH-FMN oxidoreductase RutF
MMLLANGVSIVWRLGLAQGVAYESGRARKAGRLEDSGLVIVRILGSLWLADCLAPLEGKHTKEEAADW